MAMVRSQNPGEPDPAPADVAPTMASSGLPAWLEVESGPRQGRQFQLRGTMRIGRTEDNELGLDDRRASRRHAAISREASGYTLQDLNSTNGTFLNGQRIAEPRLLKGGDRIRIGDSTLVFRWDPASTSTPPPPPHAAEPTTTAPWQSPPALGSVTPQPEARRRSSGLAGRPVVLAGLAVLVLAVLAAVIYIVVVELDRATQETPPPVATQVVTLVVTNTPVRRVTLVVTNTPAPVVASTPEPDGDCRGDRRVDDRPPYSPAGRVLGLRALRQ